MTSIQKKKIKRRFQPTLVTNIHHQKCMHFVWFPFFSLSFSFLSFSFSHFLSLSFPFSPLFSFFLSFFFFDGEPSPLAKCNTFRESYKTKLSVLGQQQTHLCSCSSFKERRPILCRFLWSAAQRHLSACKLSGRHTADYEIIYFSNRQLQWGIVKNYKLVYIVLLFSQTAGTTDLCIVLWTDNKCS